MAKLSDSRVVNALKVESSKGDARFFDDRIEGFGVRVKKSGAKSWVLLYRNKYGQKRSYLIGPAGPNGIEPSEARDFAIQLKARIAKGDDPAAERKVARDAVTVAELCDEYLEAGKGRIKESTLTVDRSRIQRHVKPLLGSRPVASLTPRDMEKFVQDVRTGKSAAKAQAAKKRENAAVQDGPANSEGEDKRKRGGIVRGGPGVASRTLGMLGTILERAVRDGVLASNPVRGVERPKENAKKPPFSYEAVAVVGQALRARAADGENAAGLRALRFLMLTGLRRMEALTLTWGSIDRANQCIRFADTKTGAQTRPIGRLALDWLATFRPKECKPGDYVFPGAEEGTHLVGLPKIWERVSNDAQIREVSLHGLRHWFASAAAAMNFSELTIAGLLGHHVKGVTARYATAPDTALLAAAGHVAMRIANVLDGRLSPEDARKLDSRDPTDNVVPFKNPAAAA